MTVTPSEEEQDMEEEPTCGRGLAQTGVVPAGLAAVAEGLAQNLVSLPSAVSDLRAAATEMASASDLPMGAHDIAAITTTDALEAFERCVAAEDDLRRLLEARREDNEQMLTAIRAEVG
jgi:hypothetical protein